jgi:hypothetical protein
MGASALSSTAIAPTNFENRDRRRERLEWLARQLPDSPLRSAILATVSEREPTVRESLAWIALLQAEHQRLA